MVLKWWGGGRGCKGYATLGLEKKNTFILLIRQILTNTNTYIKDT